MIINYQHHEGSQATKPLLIDTNSSKSIVYLRENVEEITKKDEQSGEEYSIWSYDEAQLTLEEYEVYKSEAAAQLTAKVSDDNIALMEAVAETYEQSMEAQDSLLTIMSAIADLYDAVINTTT